MGEGTGLDGGGYGVRLGEGTGLDGGGYGVRWGEGYVVRWGLG